MSADPRTTRSQDAHLGGALSKPPSSPDAPTESAVSAARPSTQPPRKARPDGLGRAACNTSTAGMTVIGESAMTSPNPVSPVRTVPQLPAIGSQGRGVCGADPFPHPPFNPCVRFSRTRLTDDLLDMVTQPLGSGWCREVGAGRAR